jgi:hypothetical protein
MPAAAPGRAVRNDPRRAVFARDPVVIPRIPAGWLRTPEVCRDAALAEALAGVYGERVQGVGAVSDGRRASL